MLEQYRFRFEADVAEHACDALLRLRPSAALALMQRAATDHLAALELPYEVLYDEGVVFMLAAIGLKFYQQIPPGAQIVVATAPVAAKGAQLLRETVLADRAGNILAEGQSAWVMVNPTTQSLLRPTALTHTLPTLGGQYSPFADVTRLKIPPCKDFFGTRQVRYSDLDRNIHMNNTVYADILCDAFGDLLLSGKSVDTLFIKYKTQAKLGDTLCLCTKTDGNDCMITAKNGDHVCFEGMMTLR